uniref:Uncharacterized protein n=1 Tax=Anguilla anguilla TaxID=7936 RepID=A0A0E9W7X9_ANGAN
MNIQTYKRIFLQKYIVSKIYLPSSL